MRLSEEQIEIIQRVAGNIFGENTHVFLFGSRVHDDLKGGDIDLLVKADDQSMTVANKILFLVALKKQLGDRKIDVVYDKKAIHQSVFLQTIKQQSIQLC